MFDQSGPAQATGRRKPQDAAAAPFAPRFAGVDVVVDWGGDPEFVMPTMG